MPLSLVNHSALALFAQRTRIPTSARSIGFCAIWVCISSSYFVNLFFFLNTKIEYHIRTHLDNSNNRAVSIFVEQLVLAFFLGASSDDFRYTKCNYSSSRFKALAHYSQATPFLPYLNL